MLVSFTYLNIFFFSSLLLVGFNLSQGKRLKRIRMSQVSTPGMVHIKSAFDGLNNEYFLKNLNYVYFLQES